MGEVEGGAVDVGWVTLTGAAQIEEEGSACNTNKRLEDIRCWNVCWKLLDIAIADIPCNATSPYTGSFIIPVYT